MTSENVVSLKRALNGAFVEIKISRDIADPIPENGLKLLLESASKVLNKAIQKRNCFKYYLICDSEFQVK